MESFHPKSRMRAWKSFASQSVDQFQDWWAQSHSLPDNKMWIVLDFKKKKRSQASWIKKKGKCHLWLIDGCGASACEVNRERERERNTSDKCQRRAVSVVSSSLLWGSLRSDGWKPLRLTTELAVAEVEKSDHDVMLSPNMIFNSLTQSNIDDNNNNNIKKCLLVGGLAHGRPRRELSNSLAKQNDTLAL